MSMPLPSPSSPMSGSFPQSPLERTLRKSPISGPSPHPPLARSVPQSPLAIQKLRQAHYKKSPSQVAKSPLRDVLKARCRERIKTSRAKHLSGIRGIQELEGRIGGAVQQEAAIWRANTRTLSFGFTAEEVEAALAELEEIQAELFIEEHHGDENNGAEMLLEEGLCPVCQVDKVKITGANISCSGTCSYNMDWTQGVAEWEEAIENKVNEHQYVCNARLGFVSLREGILAVCDYCDYCHTVVGR